MNLNDSLDDMFPPFCSDLFSASFHWTCSNYCNFVAC